MTLTDIIGYLPHGLAAVSEHGTMRLIYETIYIDVLLEGYRPVLRPMSDLATEITEKGYNDGKPFVPIVELVEAATGLSGGRVIGSIGVIRTENEDWVYNYSIRWHPVLHTFTLTGYRDNKRMPLQGNRTHHTWNQYQVYDLLHAWHFDYRGLIERGEAVAIGDLQLDIY